LVLDIDNVEPPFTSAIVEFGGVRRRVSLACVPKVACGDYVLVHAGVAISQINAVEAAKVLAALELLDLDDDFKDATMSQPVPDSRHPTPDT
jgi:hydrogenase expression/formation protein HypC